MPLTGGAKQMLNQDGRPPSIGARLRIYGRVGSMLLESRGQSDTGGKTMWESSNTRGLQCIFEPAPDSIWTLTYYCRLIGKGQTLVVL